MEYVGDLATVQQELARSHDMDRRRSDVLAALSPAPGEQVIEVGCGAGLLLRELGRAVAPDGLVLGVDLSPDQIRVADQTCSDLPNVRTELGSALQLESGDARFDASVSTQVLEYIDDVDGAISELSRVTRNGGRFLNVATNWDSLFIAGGDAGITAEVVAAWGRHAPHPNLPVTLPSRLRCAGFTSVVQTSLPIVNRSLNPATWAFGIARLMAAFASSVDAVDHDAASRWFASLQGAAARGELFMSVMPIMTTATRDASRVPEPVGRVVPETWRTSPGKFL